MGSPQEHVALTRKVEYDALCDAVSVDPSDGGTAETPEGTVAQFGEDLSSPSRRSPLRRSPKASSSRRRTTAACS